MFAQQAEAAAELEQCIGFHLQGTCEACLPQATLPGPREHGSFGHARTVLESG